MKRPCGHKGMVDLELEECQCGWSIDHEEESDMNQSWRCTSKFGQDLVGHINNSFFYGS